MWQKDVEESKSQREETAEWRRGESGKIKEGALLGVMGHGLQTINLQTLHSSVRSNKKQLFFSNISSINFTVKTLILLMLICETNCTL